MAVRRVIVARTRRGGVGRMADPTSIDEDASGPGEVGEGHGGRAGGSSRVELVDRDERDGVVDRRGDVRDDGIRDGGGGGGGDGGSSTVDPWSHRRGEPRMFAFLWLMYLLVVVLGGIAWLGRSSGLGVGAHRPTVRTLLLMTLIGVAVLWPMVRLSQFAPPWPRWRWVLADVFVVGGPVLLLIWPLSFVSAWPPRVPMVLSAGVVVWTVLVGGLIACGLAGRPVGEGSAFVDVGDDGDVRTGRRGGVRGWAGTGWMVVVVCVVLAGPMVQEGLVWIGSGVPGWLGLCSPMTMVGAVTGRGFEAPPDVLAVWTWSTLGWIGAVGVCLWIAAFVRDGGRAAEARRLRLRGRSRVAAGADREDDASSGPDGFGVAGDDLEEKE